LLRVPDDIKTVYHIDPPEFKLTEDKYELLELAKPLGADVAFFFTKGSAFCKNIGDVCEDFQLDETLNFSIATPNFGMSTKAVYDAVVLEKIIKDPIKDNIEQTWIGKKMHFFNDLHLFAKQSDQVLIQNPEH